MICPECQQKEMTKETKNHLSDYCDNCRVSYWRYEKSEEWERCYYRDYNGKSYILDIVNHRDLEISTALNGCLVIRIPYPSDQINANNALNKLKLYLTYC